jgi:hypothetical protein
LYQIKQKYRLRYQKNKLIAWGSVSASRFQAAGLAEGWREMEMAIHY